ncbi:MAG: hypothetical protein JNM27_16535 [Leptospirales bacterium]|nr:hypothetical protein [Leptospirales bacterium]
MRYETLRGSSIARLMSEMREKHGATAVLLKQREVKEGGVLGTGLFSRKVYEIHYMVPEAAHEMAQPAGSREKKKVRLPEFERVNRQELLRKLGEQMTKQPTEIPEVAAQPLPEQPTPPASPAKSQAQQQIAQSQEKPSHHITRLRERLIESRFSANFADAIVEHLDRNLSKNDRNHLQKVEEKTLERLAEIIHTVPDIAPARGECKAVMLMGPTGMGKTTSIAKLAARYFFYEKREVSLYSLDRYRLAATQQLKMYADVMKLPFHAPLNAQEFRKLTEKDPAELILVDTSGIGYRDGKRLAELKELAEACSVRLEKHLVLSANTDGTTLEHIFEAYETIGFDKILLTKLDESEFIGSFVEYADKINRPFSFCTNGQDVPADLVGPQPDDLARMILRKDAASKG